MSQKTKERLNARQLASKWMAGDGCLPLSEEMQTNLIGGDNPPILIDVNLEANALFGFTDGDNPPPDGGATGG